MTAADLIEYPQAAELAERVLAVDGVADLHSGSFGEVALLYPGHRVPGLRLDRSGRLEVHVVADLARATDLRSLSVDGRGAVGGDRPIDVVVADATGTPPATA